MSLNANIIITVAKTLMDDEATAILDAKWKAFAERTEAIEDKFKPKLRGAFTKQEKAVTAKMKRTPMPKIDKDYGSGAILGCTAGRVVGANPDVIQAQVAGGSIPSAPIELKAGSDEAEAAAEKYVGQIFNPDDWQETFETMELPFVTESFAEGGAAAYAELGVQAAFNVQNPRAKKYLDEKTFKFAKDVNTTTEDALRRTLAQGFDLGEGIPAIRKRVQAVFTTATKSRANTIARTEIVGASNNGTFNGYEESGVVETKIWIDSRDAKVRPDHRIDGQERKLKERFSNGLMHPHADGPAELVINCRCTLGAGKFIEAPVAEPIPEPVDALENITDDAFSEAPVQALRMDRKLIENQDVLVSRIKVGNKNGYVIQFKETSDDITKRVIKSGNSSSFNYRTHQPFVDDDGLHSLISVPERNGGITKTMAKGARYDGKDFAFEVMDDAAGQGFHALTGEVRLTVIAEDALEMQTKARQAFSEIKASKDFLKIPVSTDEKRLIYNKLIWQYDTEKAISQSEALRKMTLKDLKAEVKKTLTKEGFKPGQISAMTNKTAYSEIVDGYGTYRVPDKVIKEFTDEGAEFLVHSLSGQDPAPLVSIMQNGLLSSKERYSRGLIVDGMSTSADFKSGGADSVFSRIVTKSAGAGEQSPAFGYTFKINPRELGRLDHYAYSGDLYGTTKPGTLGGSQSPTGFVKGMQSSYGSSNEVMFRKAIGPEAIDEIVTGNLQNYDRAVDAFLEAGIEEINGKPITEFIRVSHTIR